MRRIVMKQSKKIFTKLCLNNWGGISHQIIEFHEYVNLFSGKSGSGKSTVMDAIQVILYGSFSPNFLNKAADDAKNKRSVFAYLRGEQKDGSANREGVDFCSNIVLEIEDTLTHIVTCVGFIFEVRKSDNEIKKFEYFSHSGRLPENEYLNEYGVPFTVSEMKKLIDSRGNSPDNRGRADVNRFYPTKDSYLNGLNDTILGFIDGPRFVTMEKSAIALKMTNGTSQFIRDYMFPKSTGDTIKQMSEQLGAYQEIRHKIEDLKKRIDSLEEVKVAANHVQIHEIKKLQSNKIIQYLDIKNHEKRIADKHSFIESLDANIAIHQETSDKLLEERAFIEDALIQVSADLKSSDLGSKLQSLNELNERYELLFNDYTQWNRVIGNLKKWEEDEIILDFVSNPMLHKLEDFYRGKINEEIIDSLRSSITETKKNLEVEYDDYKEQHKELQREILEKQTIVDDIVNDRKPYPDALKKARMALQEKLTSAYGRPIHVYVLADLFDIKDEIWKNAIEGRLGKLKNSLITEPEYAHDAAVIFRKMNQFPNVELIHSKQVINQEPKAMEGSLYEAVFTDKSYVDTVLKYYLGRVIKCENVDELETVRDGVTPDCFAYNNFIFRHLKEKDYTTFACIGTRVSKAKLKEYQEQLMELKQEVVDISRVLSSLKLARDFESLSNDNNHFIQLSKAEKSIDKIEKQRDDLQNEIALLREGTLKELEEKEELLRQDRSKLDSKIARNSSEYQEAVIKKTTEVNEISKIKESLNILLSTYVPDETLETRAQADFLGNYNQSKNKLQRSIEECDELIEINTELLHKARNHYIHEYPSCGFSGAEKSNSVYEDLLEQYKSDYEERFLVQFKEQADFIKKSLQENVLHQISCDIASAIRHTHDINRLLRNTNFSDSTYQIKIEAAKNENGQFYDMLLDPDLRNKNIDDHGYDGQLSFGEVNFYDKYESKINTLLEKFMPAGSGAEQIMQKQKEMEFYSDYRNYLSFSMFEQVVDANGLIIRENHVDDMAGKDSGGEGQNPKYVALLAGFAMLFMQPTNRDSKIKLVLLDEAFSKMDQERSAVCLKYARKMNLQLIVCVPDERLQSLIRNVDCVYGFRRNKNQIQMMHIDKGAYLTELEIGSADSVSLDESAVDNADSVYLDELKVDSADSVYLDESEVDSTDSVSSQISFTDII